MRNQVEGVDAVGADLRPEDIIEAALADVRFAGHLLVGQLDAVAGVVMAITSKTASPDGP